VIDRRRVISLAAVLFGALVLPTVGLAQDRKGYVLDWDSGTGKSYVIPAAEIVGFIAALNAFDRLAIDEETYGTDGNSIWKNLHTAPEFDKDPFRYGVIPEPLVGLRLIVSDIAMLEGQWRQYWVVGVGNGASPNADLFGHEQINRANVGLTVRVYGPHALSLNYAVSTRDARDTGLGDRHQSVETLTLAYNFLGHTRFGAVEWRPSELSTR